MRSCGNCQKYQNGACTEDGGFVTERGCCDKWAYNYEPFQFAVWRMRRVQRKKDKDWKDKQEQAECEKRVDTMLDNVMKTGDYE